LSLTFDCADPIERAEGLDTAVDSIRRGELVVIVAGAPPGTVGSTNLIHVHRIGEEDV